MAITHARKTEDTSDGCCSRAAHDRALALEEPNPRMRSRLEHSAQTWASRAALLKRLEKGREAREDA